MSVADISEEIQAEFSKVIGECMHFIHTYRHMAYIMKIIINSIYGPWLYNMAFVSLIVFTKTKCHMKA